MIVIDKVPLPVRAAIWLKRQRANWKRARSILLTETPKTFEPGGNVILLQKVAPTDVAAFMQNQMASTGRRPSHQQAAEYFGVHRSTISRAIQKVA